MPLTILFIAVVVNGAGWVKAEVQGRGPTGGGSATNLATFIRFLLPESVDLAGGPPGCTLIAEEDFKCDGV